MFKRLFMQKADEINPDIMEQNIYKIRYKSARASLRNAQAAPIALYSFIFYEIK